MKKKIETFDLYMLLAIFHGEEERAKEADLFWLADNGLILKTMDEGPKITAKGESFLKKVVKTPLPVQKWV